MTTTTVLWAAAFAVLAVPAVPTLARSLSLRMPEARFASLEGLAADVDPEASAGSVRQARHLAFAEFDRPLSDYAVAPRAQRVTRGADDADCSDLDGQIVESAPAMEDAGHGGEFCEVVQQPTAADHEFCEVPEERSGVELSSDDASFDGDQEATLCEEGIEPADEHADEAGAGRPAREAVAVDAAAADAAEAADQADQPEASQV